MFSSLFSQSGVINNAGILRKTEGTGLSTISVPISNSNLVEARNGTLSLTGPVSEVVANTLTGGKWGAVSTAVISATLNLNSNINTIGLAATVTLSGPNSSIPSIGNLASVVGSFVLANGAAFANSGNFANSGKITLNATSVLDVNGNYTQTGASKLTLSMVGSNIGRLRTLGTNLGGALEVTSTGTPPAIGTTLTILENQSATAVSGIFAGLPQDATLSFGGMTWRIRYNLGTGNDVGLTRLT